MTFVNDAKMPTQLYSMRSTNISVLFTFIINLNLISKYTECASIFDICQRLQIITEYYYLKGKELQKRRARARKISELRNNA